MATKKTRVWFVDKLRRIGIVEKGNTITKDGWTSDWVSISEVKDLRIYAISKDADLVINAMTATWASIPSQFHEGIVYKAIANGYKEPRHLDIDLARFFDGEYFSILKLAKKYSKSNYQSTGIIKQQDF